MDLGVFAVLALGGALRLFVFNWIPQLTLVLDQFVLFSTPINSYRSLNEGIFLSSNDMNPYVQGEILHHPPLLLHFFKILKESKIDDNLNTNVFFALLDVFICLQLIKINKQLNYKDAFSSFKIACFYMFNPFTLLTTFAKSTYLINNLVLVSMFSALLQEQFPVVMTLLSLSSYLTYQSWFLLIPICYHIYVNKSFLQMFKNFLVFVFFSAILLASSYLLANHSFKFMDLCYLTIIKFKKITPNLGLWWYFFTEIFEFFNDFYLSLFNLYSFIYVLPISMRFIIPNNNLNSLFAIWIIIGIINLTKAYPVLTDYSLFYSSMFIFKPFYENLKFTPIGSYSALFVVLLQSPTFYIVWMTLNSGNANFFYALGLALSVVQIIILSDFVWSFLQTEYYAEHETALGEARPKLTQL